MGTILQKTDHKYDGKTFDQHIYSVQKRLAKVLSREKNSLTVIFVGETHNTVDEKRRGILFANRPSSPSLLTVVERGMGVPTTPNVVIEPAGHLHSGDPQRDVNVVQQIATALGSNRYSAILILFGEDHERKFREKVEANQKFPDVVWHFYPSFQDYKPAQQALSPYDPRSSGYVLAGMIRMDGLQRMNIMQIAEGVMPTQGTFNIPVMSPFNNTWSSRYALFVRGPLIQALQNGLRTRMDAYLQVTWDNMHYLRIVDIEGRTAPLPQDFKNMTYVREQISEFWADAN